MLKTKTYLTWSRIKTLKRTLFLHWFIFVSILCQNVTAQNLCKIKGTVYDIVTGELLAYTNIAVENFNYGDMADKQGFYELSLAPGEYKLIFSMIGYSTMTQHVKIPNNHNKVFILNVSLTPHMIEMPSIAVLGVKYENINMREITNEFQIKTEDFMYQPLNLNDINRAFKTMPGITSNNGKRSEFNVWGGTSEENIVQIDGINLYHPYHLKEYGSSSISILNMNMMSDANLLTGGFPAKYGDALSSVMIINFRNISNQSFKGHLELGVVQSSAFIEGRFGKNSSWMFGANKSLFNVAIGLMEKFELAPKFYLVNDAPEFYDLQGKFFYSRDPNHKFSFLFINSSDEYSEQPGWQNNVQRVNLAEIYSLQTLSEQEYTNAHIDNSLLAVKSINKFSNWCKSVFILSYQKINDDFLYTGRMNGRSKFFDNKNKHIGDGIIKSEELWKNKVNLGIYEFKYDLSLKIGHFHELEVGSSIQKFNYSYIENSESELDVSAEVLIDSNLINLDQFQSFDNNIILNSPAFKNSIYIQDNWQIKNNLFSNIGVRYQYFSFNENSHISPRLMFSYRITENLNLKFAYGKYFQHPGYNEFKFQFPSSRNTQDQQATHYLIGFQQKLGESLLFKMDVFYKEYENLISYDYNNGNKMSSRLNDAEAFSKGVNFHLKYDLKSFAGWFSYSYLKARENNIIDNLDFYPRNTEQKHTLGLLFNWQVNSKWQINGKYLFGSGFPYTRISLDKNRGRLFYSKKNSSYLPSYKRIDLRISRIFKYSRGEISSFFEIINLTNSQNILGYDKYMLDEFGNFNREAIRLLPRLPNFGLRVSFN